MSKHVYDSSLGKEKLKISVLIWKKISLQVLEEISEGALCTQTIIIISRFVFISEDCI